MKKTIILTVIATLAFIASGYACKKKPTSSEATVVVYSTVIQRLTPASPRVASAMGVSNKQLEVIDTALRDLQLDLAAEGQTYSFDPSTSIIYVKHDCILSPISQTPSFLVRADDYDGTVYDYDPRPGIGKIYAAEYVITDGSFLTDEWVVCNVPDNDVYTADTARFGKEHKVLHDNDRPRFDATVNHASGPPHPLIARRALAFVEKEKPKDVAAYFGRVKGRIK